MIFFSVFLSLLFLTTSFFLYISVKKNFEFLDQQENMLEMLESSIDRLDDCYKKINKKSKLEIFSDDAVVKELVDDIKRTNQVVAEIIEELTNEKEVIKLTQNFKNDNS